MSVRMMPPMGPQMGSAPMGGPSPIPQVPMVGGMPPSPGVPQVPMGSQQQVQAASKQGLGSQYGGSSLGRANFKQFMSAKRSSVAVPQYSVAPMLPTPVPRRMADGGAVPRETVIAGQPHYLAYINPEEGELLKGLGGAEAPGPGGIPSYFLGDFFSGIRDAFSGGGGSSSSSSSGSSNRSSTGSSGYTSLDAIANQAVKDDPDTSFSYMGKSYDNISDYHDAIFGDDDGGGSSSSTTTTTPTYVDTSSISGISDASGIDLLPDTTVSSGGRDLDADLGIGMSDVTVTADDLLSDSPDIMTLGTESGGSLTIPAISDYSDAIISGDSTTDSIIGSDFDFGDDSLGLDLDDPSMYETSVFREASVPLPESYVPTSEDFMPGITGTDAPRASEDAIRSLYGMAPIETDLDDLLGGGDDLVEGSGVEADELALELGLSPINLEGYTPTSEELYGGNVPQPLSVEDQVAQYGEGMLSDYESAPGEIYGGMDAADLINESSADQQADITMENLINTGALDDTIVAGTEVTPSQAIQDPNIFNYEGDNFIYAGNEDITYGINATANAQPFENIVFHHTGNNYPAENQVNYSQMYDDARGGRFGYHFVVGKDGTIYQSAPLDARTNHIKSSDLREGFENVTSANSIGISLVGAGDDDFTPEQIAAARDLASQLQGNLDISNVYGQGAIQAGKMASEGVSLANMVNEAASSEPFDYSILDPDPEEDMDLFPVDSGEPTIPDFSIRDPEEDVGLFPADSGEGELPDIDTDTVIQNVLAGESGADIPDIDTDSVIEELLGSGVTLTPEDEELADLIVQDVLEGYTDPPGPDDVPKLSGFEKFMQSTLGELLGNSLIPFGGTLISWASSQRQSDLDKMATLLNSGNGRAVYDANGEIMGVYDLTTGEYIGASGDQYGVGGNKLEDGSSFIGDTSGTEIEVDIQEPAELPSSSSDDDGDVEVEDIVADDSGSDESPSFTLRDRNVKGELPIDDLPPPTIDPPLPDFPIIGPPTGGLKIRTPKFAAGGAVTPNIDSFFRSLRG